MKFVFYVQRYPPSQQLALDMLKRLCSPSNIIEVLLIRKQVYIHPRNMFCDYIALLICWIDLVFCLIVASCIETDEESEGFEGGERGLSILGGCSIHRGQHAVLHSVQVLRTAQRIDSFLPGVCTSIQQSLPFVHFSKLEEKKKQSSRYLLIQLAFIACMHCIILSFYFYLFEFFHSSCNTCVG